MSYISSNLIGLAISKSLAAPTKCQSSARARTTNLVSRRRKFTSNHYEPSQNTSVLVSTPKLLIANAQQKRFFGGPLQFKTRQISFPVQKKIYHGYRSMFIRTENTPNPDSLKFVPDRQLLEPGQTVDFPDALSAARSPLAKKLFRNESVKRVFIGSSFVTVTKDEEFEWENVKPIIFADLMEFFSTEEPILLDEVPISDTTILPDDSEEVAMIKELLETRIRPSVQDDGGDITYKGFIDGVVFVKLQGSCSSCPSSSVTLKNGIEKMLMHWISEVSGVVAVESDEEFEKIAENAGIKPNLNAADKSDSVPPKESPKPVSHEETPEIPSKGKMNTDEL